MSILLCPNMYHCAIIKRTQEQDGAIHSCGSLQCLNTASRCRARPGGVGSAARKRTDTSRWYCDQRLERRDHMASGDQVKPKERMAGRGKASPARWGGTGSGSRRRCRAGTRWSRYRTGPRCCGCGRWTGKSGSGAAMKRSPCGSPADVRPSASQVGFGVVTYDTQELPASVQ